MKIPRQRTLLTVAVIAGAAALYGCGGGDSGPDRTPFNQTDVDRAAATAKARAELRADAMAKAMAAASKAKVEAMKADTAAKAAAAAAAAAATAATTAGLSVADAMAQKGKADEQSKMAMDAYEAAKTAASDAAAQAARHMDAKKYSDEAMASANEAKTSAEMASAAAMAAGRSLTTAQALQGDRNTTAGDAADAGKYATMAMQEADKAAAAASDAMKQVEKAKDAATFDGADGADAAKTAAKKARAAAEMASKAADDAADKAEMIQSDVPAVMMKQKDARKYATAAANSLKMADRYLAYTSGYADARMAREQADAGKMDLTTHAGLKGRVKWIDAAAAMASTLDTHAKKARAAAESLETATAQSVIDAYKGDIADALGAVKGERTKAGDDLTAAMKIYDAAKPWSENAMGITDADKASGNTLRYTNNMERDKNSLLPERDRDTLALDNSDTRVFAAWQSLKRRGTHDLVRNDKGVVSLGGKFAPTGTNDTRYMYQVYHNNRWTTAGNTAATYDYVSFGLWARAAAQTDAAFEMPSGTSPATGNATDAVGEVNTFVFADSSDLTAKLPNTGKAMFTGSHVSHVSWDRGHTGATAPGSPTPVVSTLPATTGNTGNQLVEGMATADINFASETATLNLNNGFGAANTTSGKIFYDVTGIKLSGNMLSGGKYSGRDTTANAATRLNPTGVTAVATNDPIFLTGTTAAARASTLTLHGGVFGDKAQEVAGTVKVDWMKAHNASGAALGRSPRNAFVSILTAFGARNGQFGTTATATTVGGGGPPPPDTSGFPCTGRSLRDGVTPIPVGCNPNHRDTTGL